MTVPRAKPMTHAESVAEGERILAQDMSQFDDWERVTTPVRNPNPPITIRMSPRLIEHLDRLATAQHRKRANLIQHVLWEYVMVQRGIAAPEAKKAAPKTAAMRAGSKNKTSPKPRAKAS